MARIKKAFITGSTGRGGSYLAEFMININNRRSYNET